MKRILAVFCFCAVTFSLHSQSVFTYDLKKDIVLGTISVGVFAAQFFINNEPDGIPANLSKDDINAFDRSVMFSYNKPLDTVSDVGVYGLLVLPIISLAGNITDKDAWLTYGIMYTEAFFLTYGTYNILKNSINRNRPYVYSDGIPDGKENDYQNSFPSGSTSLAFLSAGFLSATFSAEYPDSPFKIPVIAAAYTLATGVAACRIISGSHFMTDVLAGAAIGSIYGWCVPLLHKKHKPESNVAFNVTGNGFLVSMKF